MLRFRTTGGAENGEGGDLQKLLLAVAALRGKNPRWGAMSAATHPGPKALPPPWRPQPGAPRGVKNGNFKTGDWTAEAIAERKWLRSLVQTFAKSRTTE